MHLFLRRQELCTIVGGQVAKQTPTHLDRWQNMAHPLTWRLIAAQNNFYWVVAYADHQPLLRHPQKSHSERHFSEKFACIVGCSPPEQIS